MSERLKVGLISLGCDKNRVDSEKLLYEISKEYDVTSSAEDADVLVVNTCAFLDSARKESVDTVFDYASLKENGKLKKIILAGCLPQKFIDEIYDEFSEVDGFIGTYDGNLILSVINRTLRGERVNAVGKGGELGAMRRTTTPDHYAYLKISDGCSNRCTYCLIPKIRGAFRSEPIEKLVEEARALGETDELILVAQDVTRYGEDIYGEIRLVELIRALSALDTIGGIRLLYCYPELITDELINEFKTNKKLIKYLDIPLQHASDRILKLMNRRGTFDGYLTLIEKLKREISGVAIRSTFIAGFPSETEEDFCKLKDFLSKAKLFNAGFFAYSREKDTPAYLLKGQITEKTKNARVKELYSLQKAISAENLRSFVGKTLEVVCDGVDYKKQSFFGRAYFNAPEVDGVVYLKSTLAIAQGEKYTVKIYASDDYDLYGEIINELT